MTSLKGGRVPVRVFHCFFSFIDPVRDYNTSIFSWQEKGYLRRSVSSSSRLTTTCTAESPRAHDSLKNYNSKKSLKNYIKCTDSWIWRAEEENLSVSTRARGRLPNAFGPCTFLFACAAALSFSSLHLLVRTRQQHCRKCVMHAHGRTQVTVV